MNSIIEKEKKLNEAISELKNLDLSNPDLKNNIENLSSQKTQLEIEKSHLEDKYKSLLVEHKNLSIKLEEIQNLSVKNNKKLVVYLSMAFGNPYGENYHPDIVAELTEKLHHLEIGIVALSDTIGVCNPTNIASIFSILIQEYPTIEFGAHFHTTIDKWQEKIDCAYNSGCRRFDSAIKGYGGCPMASNELIGNIPTEKLINFFKKKENNLKLNILDFENAIDNFKTLIKL